MSNYRRTLRFEQEVEACLESVLAAEANPCTEGGKLPMNAADPRNNVGEMRSVSDVTGKGLGRRRIVSLASGSRANCTLVECDGTVILVDFGMSCRMTEKALADMGITLDDVDAIFITHEHSDHVAGLNTLLRKRDIPVHMTEPSFLAFTRGKGFEIRDKITVHPVDYQCEIGGFLVSACSVSHDSAACVSYLITAEGFSFCSCTDLGFVPDDVLRHVCQAENVILESNHDITLLKTGEYPEEIKRRIASKNGHLSNDQCSSILCKLHKAGVRRVLLAHVSPENNNPELALESAILALQNAGVDFDFIGVAPRLSPIQLL